MNFCQNELSQLKRPRLLLDAARNTEKRYNRRVHLKRILLTDDLPSPQETLPQLIEREHKINLQRIVKNEEYSPARHIEILAALIWEAQVATRASEPETPSLSVVRIR